MKALRTKYLSLTAALFLLSCNAPARYDVVIVGGGTSGAAAGLQSARLGARTLLVEEFDWLGGMLTNFKTMRTRIDRLAQLKKMQEDGTFDMLPKKEVMKLLGEMEKLEKYLGGVKEMKKLPGALFVVDPRKEHNAIAEARKLHIPIVAIVDTNADPDTVEYPIPANDDAIRGIELLTSLMADAVAEGLLERSGANKAEGEAAEQPMAAWEKELLTNEAPAEASAEAAAPAAAEGETAEAPKAE